MSDTIEQAVDDLDLSKLPAPVVAKHPLREGILGVQHSVAALQEIVKNSDIHPGLKWFLKDELDQGAAMGAEGAIVDLHVLDHHNGDCSFHGHVQRVRLGVVRALPGRKAPSTNLQAPENNQGSSSK